MSTISLIGIFSLVSSLAAFVNQSLLARFLSPGDFGYLASSLAVVMILSPLMGFGVSGLWLKVFPLDSNKSFRWIPSSLKLTIISSLLAIMVLILYVMLFDNSDSYIIWILLSPIMFSVCLVGLVSSVLQVKGDYKRYSYLQSASNLLRLSLLSIVIMLDSLTLNSAVMVYFSVAVVMLLISMLMLYFGLKAFKDEQQYDLPNVGIWNVFKDSWLFGVGAFLFLICYQIDVLFIKYYFGTKEVGYYSAALVFITAAYLIPAIIYQKFFLPKFHNWFVSCPSRLTSVKSIHVATMFVLGIIVSTGLFFLAEPLIGNIYNDSYVRSIEILKILVLCIPLRFSSAPLGALMSTGDTQRVKILIMFFSAIVNVAANFFAVPRYGAIGAALTTVGTELLIFMLFYMAVYWRFQRI